MRKIPILIFLFILQIQFAVFAAKPFRFALFSDMHISDLKPQNTLDLRLAIKDVNKLREIEFVIVSGDVSDLGDLHSLQQVKTMLDSLKMPYYITSGNHDIKQNTSGNSNFINVFGKDKFSFVAHNNHFIGFPTGPVRGKNIGHIDSLNIEFVKSELKKQPASPTFVITHYPLLEGDVNNRAALTAIMLKYPVKAVLCGHYHRNVFLNFDGIPGIVNRSTQQKLNLPGGYSIYTVDDSLSVGEKEIGVPEVKWLTLPLVEAANGK
jgi:3',5'-cyclic AMP phosphodiesterase CpdA